VCMAMAEGLQQPMMTHQAALASQPPMEPPSMATMTHQAPANSYPLAEREPMHLPSMATMTHQTPANSYPLAERERPFACPDCEKAYPTAAGLCARHPPTRHVPRAALGIVACSLCRRAPRLCRTDQHKRSSHPHLINSRGPARPRPSMLKVPCRPQLAVARTPAAPRPPPRPARRPAASWRYSAPARLAPARSGLPCGPALRGETLPLGCRGEAVRLRHGSAAMALALWPD